MFEGTQYRFQNVTPTRHFGGPHPRSILLPRDRRNVATPINLLARRASHLFPAVLDVHTDLHAAVRLLGDARRNNHLLPELRGHHRVAVRGVRGDGAVHHVDVPTVLLRLVQHRELPAVVAELLLHLVLPAVDVLHCAGGHLRQSVGAKARKAKWIAWTTIVCRLESARDSGVCLRCSYQLKF